MYLQFFLYSELSNVIEEDKVEVEVEVAVEVDVDHVKYSLYTLTKVFILFCASFFLILILTLNLIYAPSFCFVRFCCSYTHNISTTTYSTVMYRCTV